MYDNLKTKTNQASGSNHYNQPSGFIANPYDAYYQNPDAEISDRHEIQQIIYLIQDQEDKVEGDYDIDELSEHISNDTMAYCHSGLRLAKIRFLRLYKDKYSNFTDFCEQKLGRSRSYADRLIKASRVVVELIMAGCSLLPRNESQCRLLSEFTGSELIWRWKAIIETFKPHEITAKAIAQFLEEKEEKSTPPEKHFFEMPDYLADRISFCALKMRMTAQDFLIKLLELILKPAKPKANWRDFEAEEEWEADLEKLVEEGENFLNSE